MKKNWTIVFMCFVLLVTIICEFFILMIVGDDPEFYKNVILYLFTFVFITIYSVVFYIYRRKKNHIYISYDSKNETEASEIVMLIKQKFKQSIIFTYKDIIDGDKITTSIAENMSHCSCFIMIIDGELSQLQVQEFKCWKHREMRIYPILLSETKIPSQLKDYKTYALDEFKCNITKLLQLK